MNAHDATSANTRLPRLWRYINLLLNYLLYRDEKWDTLRYIIQLNAPEILVANIKRAILKQTKINQKEVTLLQAVWQPVRVSA